MVCAPTAAPRRFADTVQVIEDFFRLLIDALIYYNHQFIPATICGPTFSAAIASLVLQQEGPLIMTLHYIRDFLSYGTDRPTSSRFGDISNAAGQPSAAELQKLVRDLVIVQGEALVRLTLVGMMFSFPRDCLQDASGILITLFELMPQQTAAWFGGTIATLPAGSVKAGEADRIMNNIAAKIQAGDLRKLKSVLQGTASNSLFTNLQLTYYRLYHLVPPPQRRASRRLAWGPRVREVQVQRLGRTLVPH